MFSPLFHPLPPPRTRPPCHVSPPQLRAEEAGPADGKRARRRGAGACARLKDGRRRSAAAAPEVTLGPAVSLRSRGQPLPPYHEASESPHPGLDLFSGRSLVWRGSTGSTP